MASHYENLIKSTVLPCSSELSLGDVVPGCMVYKRVNWRNTSWLAWQLCDVDIQLYRMGVTVWEVDGAKSRYRSFWYDPDKIRFYSGMSLTPEQRLEVAHIRLRRAWADIVQQEAYLLPVNEKARERELSRHTPFTTPYTEWKASQEGQAVYAEIMENLK